MVGKVGKRGNVGKEEWEEEKGMRKSWKGEEMGWRGWALMWKASDSYAVERSKTYPFFSVESS